MRVRPFAIIGLALGLMLSGCSEDYGTDQHGSKIPAQGLENRWLIINYWADWCAPCRKEVPELNAFAKEHSNIRVLGVNYDHLQGDELLKAAQLLGIEFTVLATDPAERFALPRSQGLPASFIVDPQGRLRAKLYGEQSRATLTKHLAELKVPL